MADCKPIDWTTIDTVLLDMDGTLLDLHFDNYFWLDLVPLKHAAARGIHVEAARAELKPRFDAQRGQLNWYCTDYWSRELKLDIASLKREARDRIRWLPGAERFLQTLQMLAKHPMHSTSYSDTTSTKQLTKKIILVTNAHCDSLTLKHEQTGLGNYFHALVSSHSYGYPKEHALFWERLCKEQSVDPKRTLFIDDSLAVLQAARAFGIRHLIAVTHPDSTQPMRECAEFPAVDRVAQLLVATPQ